MLIQWNLIDKMLDARLHIEKAIIAILTTQTWDKLVKQNLTPTKDD